MIEAIKTARYFQRVATGMIAAAVLTVFAFLGLFTQQAIDAREQAVAEAFNHADMISRFAEDHAFRSFQSVEEVASRIATGLPSAHDLEAVEHEMRTSISRSTLIREMALVDGRGVVIVSTEPSSVGKVIADLDMLANARAVPGVLQVGAIAQGRTLGEDPATAARSERRFLPTAYVLPGAGEGASFVVATINTEYFAAAYDALPGSAARTLRLMSYSGRPIASMGPGADQPSVAPFDKTPFDGSVERSAGGRYVDQEADGAWLSAYRVTRVYPLVVTVGIARSAALASWWERTWFLFILLILVAALVFAAIGLLLRQLKGREKQRDELKRSEAVARRMQSRLSDAVASLSEGFALFDSADRLVAWNRQYEVSFPYLVPHLEVGVPFGTLTEIAARHAQLPEQQARDWTTWRMECHRNPGKPFEQFLWDGRLFHTSETRTAEGGIVLISRDITQERAASRALEQALVNADAANRAKSEFVATVSHEIRTPMNAVIGLAALLLETRLDEEQTNYARGIEQSANRLLGLINDVLDFSRLDAGKLELATAPMDLHALVEEAATTCWVLVGDKPVSVTRVVRDDVPRWVAGDSGRLYQVLLNFVGNAAKFTDSGEICCRASRIDRGGSTPRIRLEVVDSGPGLSPDQSDRMFEPFERGSAATNEQVAGAGLGLAISRRLVELMGGTIGLDSRPGAGATAYVELDLPVVDGPEASVPQRPEAGAATRHLDILAAEDTPASQLVIRAMLEKRGHRVTVVANGAEAVEEARHRRFDLIILDIQMPVMGGLEAARHIRALDGCAQVPLVALSAQAQPEMKEKAMAHGMSGYIVKPIRPRDLDGLLDAVIEKRPLGGECAVSATAMLDTALLDDLRQTMPAEALPVLVGQFDADATALLDQLPGLAGDAARLRKAAHKLAGLFGQFGALETSTVARELETAAAAGIPVDELIRKVIRGGERDRPAIRLHLDPAAV